MRSVPSVVAVRVVGVGLAAATVVGAGLARGGSSLVPSASEVPLFAVVLAGYLGAFVAATRRGCELPPRVALVSVGLGLLTSALFAAAVPVLPPAVIFLAYLLIAAAAAVAGWLPQPQESRPSAALLATVTACQAVFFAAAVLYHYGPDAWMPYAGPGPLTPQAQIEQNRAEAIDPYVGLLFIGLLAAAVLIGLAVADWRRTRTGAAPTVIPER
jgi:hypothetical protein